MINVTKSRIVAPGGGLSYGVYIYRSRTYTIAIKRENDSISGTRETTPISHQTCATFYISCAGARKIYNIKSHRVCTLYIDDFCAQNLSRALSYHHQMHTYAEQTSHSQRILLAVRHPGADTLITKFRVVAVVAPAYI